MLEKPAACELRHVLTPSISFLLLLKHCDPNQFVRYETSGSCSKRDQDCKESGQTTPNWNAPTVFECEQLYADAHCHGGALHRISAFHAIVLNGPMQFIYLFTFIISVLQYTSDVIVVSCWMNSTISTPFLSQKTIAINFLAGNIHLIFSHLFGECVYIHCFDCSLFSTLTN
jgi:hypothetical protein